MYLPEIRVPPCYSARRSENQSAYDKMAASCLFWENSTLDATGMGLDVVVEQASRNQNYNENWKENNFCALTKFLS